MNGTITGLRISSRHFCAFKMHLCSLSITYACPYHNPTATMGHSIHSVDIRDGSVHVSVPFGSRTKQSRTDLYSASSVAQMLRVNDDCYVHYYIQQKKTPQSLNLRHSCLPLHRSRHNGGQLTAQSGRV